MGGDPALARLSIDQEAREAVGSEPADAPKPAAGGIGGLGRRGFERLLRLWSECSTIPRTE